MRTGENVCSKFSKERNNQRTEHDYLKCLGSTEDLCAFYKNKVARLEEKFGELWNLLDRINVSCKKSSGLQAELLARTSEVTQLQLAVSDLQVFLFREREENLRLSAENDDLKIKDYENKRSVDILLKLSGLTRSQLDELLTSPSSAFEQVKVTKNNNPVSNPNVKSKRPGSGRSTSSARTSTKDSSARELPSRDALMLQVKSLKTQLENLRTLARNQVDVLLKDREVVAEERGRDASHRDQQLTLLTTNLRQMQDDLTETAKRLVQEQQWREQEVESWRKEKVSLEKRVLTLSCGRENPSVLTLNGVGGTSSSRACQNRLVLARVGEQERLANVYHQQCKRLEIEVKKWKECAETTERLFKDKTQSLSSDLAVMKNRYLELERRRTLEAEGFRTDVRLLREQLKQVNKAIVKMKYDDELAAQAQTPPEDLKSSTQHTLQRAKQFEKEVAALKFKFASLTHDYQ